MENVQNKENRIINGVIWKQLLIFFFPIVLGTFFQQIYNTADAVVVGRFVGTEALAAVGGSTSQIINLIVGFLSDFLPVQRWSSPSIMVQGRNRDCKMRCILRLPFRWWAAWSFL